MQALRRGDLGHPDLVVDVQNGLPFFTRLVTRAAGDRAGAPRAPRAVAGGLPRARWARSAGGSSAGSPRGSTAASQYVTGSQATRDELAQLGRATRTRIAVVHNGTDRQRPRRGRARPSTRASAWWAGWCRTSRSSTRSTPSLELRARAPRPAPDRRRQRLVGARAAGVRRGARRAATPWASRAGRRGTQGGDLRGVVGAGAALAEGGLGPGRRRGGAGTAPRRWPTPAPAAPASRSSTASRGCWSTTTDGVRRRAAPAAGRRRRCGTRSAEGAREHSGRFTWEQTQSAFAARGRAASLRGRRASSAVRTSRRSRLSCGGAVVDRRAADVRPGCRRPEFTVAGSIRPTRVTPATMPPTTMRRRPSRRCVHASDAALHLDPSLTDVGHATRRANRLPASARVVQEHPPAEQPRRTKAAQAGAQRRRATTSAASVRRRDRPSSRDDGSSRPSCTTVPATAASYAGRRRRRRARGRPSRCRARRAAAGRAAAGWPARARRDRGHPGVLPRHHPPDTPSSSSAR